MTDEAARWRERYTGALDRFRDDELRWKAIEEVLRKLIHRLCSIAHGRSALLDTPLRDTRQAMRREALDAAQLHAIEQLLSTLALQLEDPPQEIRPPAAEAVVAASAAGAGVSASLARVRSLLVDLVRRLPDDLLHSPDVVGLSAALQRSDGVEALIELTTRLADQLAQRVDRLEKEREHLHLTLAQVSHQLNGIDRYLNDETQFQVSARSSGDQLNGQVLEQVQLLRDSSLQARELSVLQSDVRRRMGAIDEHLTAFREREEARLQAWEQRVNEQRQRIEALENEVQVVQHRLRQREREVLTDTLTQLSSRRAYDERIQAEVQRFQRQPHPLCLAVVDIDHFKKINDAHGHQIGDQVLQTVARHLQRCVREQDFVARYGGEEFVVLMDGMDIRQAFKNMDRIRQSVERLELRIPGAAIALSVSVGVAGLLSTDTAQSLFERADKALYQAKGGGRNRTVTL